MTTQALHRLLRLKKKRNRRKITTMEMSELLRLDRRLELFLSEVEDPIVRKVLCRRYIDLWSWNEIAAENIGATEDSLRKSAERAVLRGGAIARKKRGKRKCKPKRYICPCCGGSLRITDGKALKYESESA